MFAVEHSRFGQAAMVVGGLALAMMIANFFIPSGESRAWVFTGAFLVLAFGIVLATSGDLLRRHQRVTFRPHTQQGRLGLWLSIGGVALLVAGGVVSSVMRAAGPGGPAVPMFAFTVGGFGLLVAGGVLALIAWFRHGESAWTALLPLLPALFAVYFVVGEFTFPH